MAITTTDIHTAADALVARGKKPTLAAIRAELGTGSFSTIGEGLKTWKQQQGQQAPAVTAPEAVAQRAAELAVQVWVIAQEEAEQRMQLERAAMAQRHQELEAGRAEAMEAADSALAAQEVLQQQLEATKAERDAIQQQMAVLQAQLAEAVARAERAEVLANTARAAETEAREAAAGLRGRLEAVETAQVKTVGQGQGSAGAQMSLETP